VTITGSERFYNELANDPALSQYFDSEPERQAMMAGVADIYWQGGITTKDGQIDFAEGVIMPWNDPKYAGTFRNWETGEDLDAQGGGNDISSLTGQETSYTITDENGMEQSVTQSQVNTDWGNFTKSIENSDSPVVVDEDFRQEWWDHYKNGTLESWDYAAQANSELLSSVVESVEAVGGNNLAIGNDINALVSEESKEYLPNVSKAIQNGTVDDIYPDLYIGEKNATDLSFWDREGFGEKGNRRTVITQAGKDWFDQNHGKILTINGSEYVLVGITEDSGEANAIQKIKVYDVANDEYKYIGRGTVAGRAKVAGAYLAFLPEEFWGGTAQGLPDNLIINWK